MKLLWKIDEVAFELAKDSSLLEFDHKGEPQWKYEFAIKDEVERKAFTEGINKYRSEAAIKLGYKEDVHRNLRWRYKDNWSMRGIEVKVSYSDFKNGFSMTPEYSYVLAPVGIVPQKELPQKVGLLEFDFDKYTETKRWLDALIVTKKPKKEFDSVFYEGEKQKSKLNHEKHQQFCRDMLFKIAQQNTEESIFWNPHMIQMENGYVSPRSEEKYRYRIGDDTPKGIVVERRMGRNPDKNDYKNPEIPFYRFVVVGEGLTKWVPQIEMEGGN